MTDEEFTKKVIPQLNAPLIELCDQSDIYAAYVEKRTKDVEANIENRYSPKGKAQAAHAEDLRTDAFVIRNLSKALRKIAEAKA